VSLSPKKFVSNDDKGMDLWTLGDFGAFYSQHRREFLNHATRLLKDPLKAEEVVQEALMKVMLAAPELTSEAHATAYVHKVVENLAIDLYRLEGRRPNLVLLDEETLASERIPHQDLSDAISAADDAVIVRQALSMLSPAERAALVMWEMEGRSSKEIARELGIKESSVRHTVSRARASLRKVMSQLVIDEVRGLTALDLLSSTYKKAAGVAKNSS
jgi:RNA polymerase sigma factor (sigma-70 family)